MTITEPLELAASWLQVQLEVANHTAALDLEGALDATGKALVLQGWSLLTSAAKPRSHDSHGFQLPIWACILGLILILAMMFYLANFMLWARREKAQRVHDLEDAKMHSEHGNLLGGLIEAAIERFDESLFGVNVDFGAMKVTVSEGVVVIHDLTIENPAGYWSTHFLHIGELLIDLDLQSFITSMGKEVVIQRLELRDVEVIWEGGLVSSNMRDILKCMSGRKDDSNQSDKNRQKEGGERRTSVQEVLAQDISLKLASYWFCGSGPRIMVEDFYSQNLDEHQMGELEIPQCLLTMLLSSILANVLGQSIARFIMDGTSFGFAAVAHGIWHLVVLMRSACCCPPSPTKRDRPSRPKRPRAETERGSSTGTCGSCGSCLPCETLLQKKPAAKPSGNT